MREAMCDRSMLDRPSRHGLKVMSESDPRQAVFQPLPARRAIDLFWLAGALTGGLLLTAAKALFFPNNMVFAPFTAIEGFLLGGLLGWALGRLSRTMRRSKWRTLFLGFLGALLGEILFS